MKTFLRPRRCLFLLSVDGKIFLSCLAFSFTVLFQPLLHGEDGREPNYKGKPLQFWLDDYDSASYALSMEFLLPFTEEQTNAVLHMGTNAIPWLVKRLSNTNPTSLRGTIAAFRTLGPLARCAIPDLVRLVAHQPESSTPGSGVPTIPTYPMLALGGIGTDALPALLDILTNSMSAGRRLGALDAIAGLGTNAGPALPILERYVNDTNYLVADYAENTIWIVHNGNGQEPSYQGKSLHYWLDDYSVASDRLSTRFLFQFTKEQTNAVLHMGTKAVPWLIKRFSNPKFSERRTVQAFRVLGSRARSAIPDLVHLVTNQPDGFSSKTNMPYVGYEPMLALGGIGKEAVPVLTDILTNSKSPGRKLGALEAIESIGTNAADALPVLVRNVYDTNYLVASQAVRALGSVGAGQPSGFQAFKQILQIRDPRKQIRGDALLAAASLGENCAPLVIPALNEGDEYYIAFMTLLGAAPDALTNAVVLRLAATGLRSSDFERQDWASQMLRAAGQQAGGEQPDSTVPGGDMKAIYREATNALSHLAPGLYDGYLAAAVPFHSSITNTPSK